MHDVAIYFERTAGSNLNGHRSGAKSQAESNGRGHGVRAVRHADGEDDLLYDELSQQRIETAVRQILGAVGEDPMRDGLIGTPGRVARMYHELLEGYAKDLDRVINGALFDVDYDDGEMVTVADIPYTSLCEHHMLPFVGTAHVAYIPRDRVVGLSKIPRIVDMFAKRLQIQERLTNEIAGAIEAALDPQGIMVVVEGTHSCASLRGVKKHGVNMITTARRGLFREDVSLRDDFYRQIGR
ncbi:MAG: GTP cyclohydrolase I FolE [Caldilineae bacterium]|nr:GTP cyclohydrolase I FolE [Chloroflexota bacterium]MCB9176162.1 GTP cyclohydrolase I FolE [Caldilineae bacterium]